MSSYEWIVKQRDDRRRECFCQIHLLLVKGQRPLNLRLDQFNWKIKQLEFFYFHYWINVFFYLENEKQGRI